MADPALDAGFAAAPRAAGAARAWDRVLAAAERRLPALTRHRTAEALPIALHARRIYVLPTGYGLLFGAVLAVMLIGGLNYTNNAALLLTFLIAGAALLSLSRTVATLRGVRLDAVRAEPVQAGESLQLALTFSADGDRPRPTLRLAGARGSDPVTFALHPAGSTVRHALPTRRRGWQRVGRVTLSTEHPLGLFRAWSVLHPDLALLVHPRAEAKSPPLPRRAARERGPELKPLGEEWSGLRDYRLGDAPRLIAWKATARQDRLMVKEFVAPQSAEVELAWHDVALPDVEARIARLARWVLEADEARVPYRLVLPGGSYGPASTPAHRAECLRALALA